MSDDEREGVHNNDVGTSSLHHHSSYDQQSEVQFFEFFDEFIVNSTNTPIKRRFSAFWTT
jgi:hypothetical protein